MERVVCGKYRLLSRVQSGGFGTTWLALDTMLDMQVAVKEYTNTNEKQKRHFLEEARSLAKFAGEPGIVNVREYLEEDDKVYLVMEYLDGKDLKTYVEEKGALPFSQAYHMLRPVMLTLDKLHQNGMIHRDVSPENIRMLSNGQLKLLDFGSALEIDHEYTDDKTMTVMVKPGYAPQEQYMSKSLQGAWTDVYAVCATLYKCITGKTPVDSLQRSFSDVLEKPSELGCGISQEQEAVLMRGMALRTEERFASMTELIEQLDDVLNEKLEESKKEDDKKTEESKKEDGKKAEEERFQPVRKKKFSKGKIVAVSLGVFVILGILAVALNGGSFSVGDPYRKSGDNTAEIREMEVDEDMLALIAEDSEANSLYLSQCTLGREEIEAISDMKNIKRISLYKCMGYSDLSPLAKMEQLENLNIDGDYENLPDSSKGEQLFSVDFPQVTSLNIDGLAFADQGECLRHFRNLENLTLMDNEGLGKMEFLETMMELTHLHMASQDASPISESLAACTKLRYGYFNECGMNDLSWALGCKELERLYVNQCSITDLSPLAGCQKLWLLEADDNQIQDISGLQGCSKLSSVSLAGNQIRDISALQDCNELSSAVFSRNQIKSLKGLEGKEKLTTLTASKNQLADLAPLSGCTSLMFLELDGNQLKDLDACEGMLQLKMVTAADNQLTDASGLANDTSIKVLNLENNQLTGELGWMKNFTELETFIISRNQISSIQGIENNVNMKMLAANENQIADIAPLEQMASLNVVCLSHNQIGSIDELGGKSSLNAILASDNRITDISALGTSLGQLMYLDLGSNEITDIKVCSGLSGKEKVLLLENNQIVDISALPRDIRYRGLTLYGNPIKDFSVLKGVKEVNSTWDVGYFPYEEGFQAEHFSNYRNDNLHIVDAPAEQKSAVMRELKELQWGTGTPVFQTKEEADEELENFRKEIYDTVLGRDSEEETPDGE